MDELKNKAEGAAGKAKEAAGDATNNEELKNEGRADQVSSDIKEKANELKDKASDAFNKIVGDAKN
ncbi:MAG TPA: CsbD family protein [Candidatus Corynebacterium gallistercoris]|uniref:CsbD family protein n=1 Tax=Candidatus Corynebacterium gallistercoris TaxID=2838530 RepID=A0A9D1UP23_9CORY|nr:CsbD family protein [Candidatus Corynebacterium gallistercoris]